MVSRIGRNVYSSLLQRHAEARASCFATPNLRLHALERDEPCQQLLTCFCATQTGDFKTWDDLYGPVHIHGDTFTNLVRFNLSDKYQTFEDPVSDYRRLKGIVPVQTFDASDIVLLQDGRCASTCAVFSEFMKSQGHVGQVVMGGE